MRKTYFALIMLAGLLLLMAAPALSVEYIIQYDDGITAYYSGRPQTNDTCGVWFEPPTESQIISGLFQFNDGMGGDAYLYLWYLAPDFDPDNYYDSDEPNASPGPTPLGEVICGPFLISFTGGDWEEIDFEGLGVPPEDLDVGLENFYLGYVLVGGAAQPYYPSILGDAADDRPYHSLCYLADPGGSYPGESGWWAYGIDWMIRAKVDLYGDPPPFIEDLADPPDTYTAGPYTITATIVDMDETGVPGSGQVTEARLIYTVDGGDEVTVIMAAINDTTYAGDVAAVGVGSRINFRVEADDNAAHTAIAPSLAGYNFTYRSHSGATILLVNDSGGNADETVYINALGGNGFSYDYWYIDGGSPDDMGYPGSDVINTANYRTILWFNGTANSGSLPDNDADLAVDPVANFMDDGGNFFLSSSDYIGGAFNPDIWTEFTAIPGTFMYEYLMVEDGWSDSHLDEVTGESMDTLYFGIDGDPISGDYTGGFYDYPDPNYNDFTNPVFGSGAETCFETEIDNESAGIRYDGDFKMVFLPWVLEACEDPAVAEGILLCVLEYFNEGAGPEMVLLQGSRYGIYSNVYAPTYPGDVPHRAIAQVTDPDGVASVTISILWDDGDWTSHNMGDIGDDQYRYIFTDPGAWNNMHYRIVATDNLGNVAVGPDYECWTTGLEYTEGDIFLLCSDQPYESLIGENFDPKVTTKLDQLGIDYAIWDVDECGTPDFWTVLNKYQHCFWVGYADWDLTFPVATEDNPFRLYLANGKNLLFSSEEQLGVWTDWVDTKFAEGNFAYDWMGVDSLVNDVGYTEVNLSDPPDPQCSGMAATIALETLYWPPMGDLLTPTDFGTPTLFYGNGWWCGFRDDDPQHNRTVLGFCLFQLPQAQADIFVWNVYSYWLQHQGYSTGVEPEEGATPITYRLDQNYPNPFNPVTQIRFSLPEFTRVELAIYNLMGQEVARLLDRDMAIGNYAVTWDASQLASGVYFYKLKTTNFESVRKMIMVK